MTREEVKVAIQNYYKTKAGRTSAFPPKVREAILSYVAERVKSGISATVACSEINFSTGNYYNWKKSGPKVQAYVPTLEKAPSSPPVVLREIPTDEIRSLEIIVRHPMLGVITVTGAKAVKGFERMMKDK